MAPTAEQLTKEVTELRAQGRKRDEEFTVLTKNFNTLIDKKAKTPAANQPAPGQVFGTPFIRHGEDSMSSRGFSFMKMIGLMSGACNPDEAKHEIDIHNRLHNVYCKELGQAGYEYKGGGITGQHRFMAPLATSFMQDSIVPRSFRHEMKMMVAAGTDGADYDQMRHIRTKQLQGMGYDTKALSWLNELTGGAIVAPPEMGELIELLRNKEALVNAGARVVPLHRRVA